MTISQECHIHLNAGVMQEFFNIGWRDAACSFDIRIECALFGAGRDCVHVKGTSGSVTGVWANSRTLKEN
jgi:hypothetical protein